MIYPDPITISRLITMLEACDRKLPVYFDFPGHPAPTGIISYRGYFNEPAFEYDKIEMTVQEVIDMLRYAIKPGTIHYGYKGGEYQFDENQTIYVSQYGAVSGVRVNGIIEEETSILLATKYDRYA